ncbi:unnamed protein product, partial [Ilex paraguariensis]
VSVQSSKRGVGGEANCGVVPAKGREEMLWVCDFHLWRWILRQWRRVMIVMVDMKAYRIPEIKV